MPEPRVPKDEKHTILKIAEAREIRTFLGGYERRVSEVNISIGYPCKKGSQLSAVSFVGRHASWYEIRLRLVHEKKEKLATEVHG